VKDSFCDFVTMIFWRPGSGLFACQHPPAAMPPGLGGERFTGSGPGKKPKVVAFILFL
jgi:hypothetical protein